jgi:hypothetical protein
MNGTIKGSIRHALTHPEAQTQVAQAAQNQPPPKLESAKPAPQELGSFQSLKLEVAMMVYAAIYARSSFTPQPAKDAWEAAELFIEEMQTREKQ